MSEQVNNDEVVVDTVAVAKRWFGGKTGGAKVDCMQRAFDYKWEMIRFMPDPSLDASTLVEIKARNIPHPYRWVTVAVVEPFVVEGINKSLNSSKEAFKDGR